MGCCGKKRSPSSRSSAAQPAPAPLTMKSANTPAELQADLSVMGDPGPGNVWARYVDGRGMGKHDKRGMASRKRYQRVQYAGVYQVKAEDAITPQQFQSGERHGGFVRLEPTRPPAPPPPPPRVAEAVTERTPVQVQRAPLDQDLDSYIDTMSSMTVKEMKDLLDKVDFGPDELQALIDAERNAKDRIGAVKLLEKYRERLMA